ncbi:MAG: DUF1800 domain-containing protein [Dehalococcoidia bacterium]|nr:DUF1800 domain-containing protein [Dehalococcoidia bacterium]
MADERTALLAHLMRRAGVGATQDELATLAGRPYEEVVEDLLHPDRFPEVSDDVLFRYYPQMTSPDTTTASAGRWVYRMVNTQRPLEEKMALFWHHVFATAWFKGEHMLSMADQIQTFREHGLGKMRDLLVALSRDPAMIYWLDNCENHADNPNENYGRELLELFSMGIGTYDETDVKMAGRAFTGWTFEQPIPLYPHGGYPARFVYRPEDHDESEKTFLGETGPFNGEDVIDIIVRQEATARFISRHLYNFFVADEPQVAAWSVQAPNDPDAIDQLASVFLETEGDLRKVMRTLLNAEFFKQARFAKVKSPAEFVAGVLKFAGTLEDPTPLMGALQGAMGAMGQKLMDPPSVEGWHTGKEWIDGGTLMERVNFAVQQVGDPASPGTQAVAARLANGGSDPAETLVDGCLEAAGPLEASDETREALLAGADPGDHDERVARMLTLVVATPEYQFA